MDVLLWVWRAQGYRFCWQHEDIPAGAEERMIKDQRVTLLHPARPQAPGGDISDVTETSFTAKGLKLHGNTKPMTKEKLNQLM